LRYRSTGARIRFTVSGETVDVFTTRPDTLFGATYLVLAPEHPLVGRLTAAQWPDGADPRWTAGAATPAEAVAAYQLQASRRSELERQTEGRDKTGVWLGVSAVNPLTGRQMSFAKLFTTHPPTEERIARLRHMHPGAARF